jgi:hypothetical protein
MGEDLADHGGCSMAAVIFKAGAVFHIDLEHSFTKAHRPAGRRSPFKTAPGVL